MRKTNTGKRVVRLLVILLIIGFLAGQASAYTAPYRLMVFTDKQVYLDFGYNFDTAPFTYTQADNTKGSFNQRPNVFAVLLDSDGNIVRGLTGSNFSATIKDLERWNHSGPALDSYPFYQVITTNGAYYNSLAFPAFTDADGDGIFNSSYDVTDLNQLGTRPAVTDQVNISINVTVSYQGTNYKTNVSVIFGTAGCHHPGNTITSAHSRTAHDNVVCTACHWGYQYALGVHGFNNSIMYNDPARYKGPDTVVTAGYDYKLGYVKTGGNATTWENSNASFCVMCHGGPVNRNILDLGVGSAPSTTDQNGDGAPDNVRPSCSWYQGPLGNGSAYPVCHSPAQGFDGSTKITWSSLNGTDWKGWTLGPGKSKSHNHSISPSTNGTPCELCHAGGGAPGTGTGGLHNVAGLPNRSTDYTNINEQCWNCHNTTDGWLNITSNGGTAKNHSKTNQCSNCHVDNNKLNSHTVPVGAYGGRWCMDCHNLTGKAPIDMKVDPSITNISNLNYIHYDLNDNSDASNSSRICWGCHANNSYVINGRVNSTSLPLSEHPGGYDSPRSCTYCHNNSNGTLNFGAPQTYRHTWYAPNMNTPAVIYCVNCHAQDEDLNLWSEDIYPPKTDNESTAHYGKNRTIFFQPLIGKREYCGYCHQNESTVMGPFANRDNEVRSDHASQATTPGCGDIICHRPGRMHEDTLVIPSFTEANISATCLACHSSSNYSYHNSTLSCWDCHMGNVSNTTAIWIHPIQFIQYNGNFTGAKLTGATCYDCHKSVRVDSTIKNLSGKNVPKIYNQAHSNDLMNGTKWGNYWKYTPTTYEFASYDIIGNGTIDPAYPFENIKVPSNDYMQLKETQTGSPQGGMFPYTKAERQINGPPVPNWTSSTKVTLGTTTLTVLQDAYNGNPAGSLKTTLKTRSSSGSGSVSWNYSFYYNPNSTQFAYTTASADYNITVSSALTQTVYLRLVKPSGIIVTLASASSSSSTGWLTLTNNSFASAFDEDGSVVPYKIQLYTVLNGTGSRTVQNPYTVYYDNFLVTFQEKVWNRYDIIINTTGVPVNGSSKLGMSYQVHNENTSLMIFNRTSRTYELLDTLDKGVFFDYVKDIDSTHHIDPIGDGTTGNVSVRFVDTDTNETDAISDKLHIRYLYVFTDRGLQYPCEQCHSPNKHYIDPTLGSPEKFNAGNRVNQTISSSSTWCQQCHWQGSANYSKMIQEYNVTRNPPENIPPEITGNKTYGNFTKSRDGKTSYINHTGSAYSDMSDLGCFKCHGKTGDTTTSQFIHNVQVGQSGNRRCTTCHNANATNYKKIDVNSVKRGMHGGLKNASANVSNTSDPIELACWACHGDGTYNSSDQHRNANAWTCDKCHTNATSGKLGYNAPMAYEHIPPNLTSPEADIKTTFNGTSWACANCHNNSINNTALINDNEIDPTSARAGHYGLNRTAGKLMYDYSSPPKGNSENCTYCHKGNNPDMTKWGIDTSSTMNLSNKVSPTDHRAFTNNDCGGCHNYTSIASFTFHAPEINAGAGGSGGPNCTMCHDTGGSAGPGKLVNSSAMNDPDAIHKNLNSGAITSLPAENKKCWACHDEGSEPSGHNQSRYKTPYNCTDCHTATGSKSGKYQTWNVTEHVKAGTASGTEIFTPQAGNCYACHNRSEMMVGLALDPDGASANIYGGSNGGNNSTSHYGKKRDLGSGDTYCNYCHSNVSSIFYLSNQNRTIFEHTANNSADTKNNSLNCNNALCHGTGRIHNDTMIKPSVQAWTSGKQDYCAPCHRAGDPGATRYVYGHNSSNMTAINTDCGYCHNATSQGQTGGMLRIHTSTLTNRSPTNTTCVLCHRDSTYVTSQRVIYTHYPGASSGKANTSLDNFACETCHGGMPANKMHEPVNTPADRCNNCHNGTSSGSYKATKVPYINATRHDNASHNVSNVINCDWCHNNTNAVQRFHFTQWPNGTVQSPGWAGWANGTNANCTNCHDTYNQTKPFYAEPVWHKGSYGATPDNCYQCHTSISSAASGSAPVAMHNVTRAIDWSYCNNCHSNNYGGAPLVDNASLANSMHYNLNGSTPSSTEPACKACHGGNSTMHRNAIANNCTYCHINGSTKYSAKGVSRHIPYPYTSDVNTSRYSQVFCSDCHNNSIGTFNDPTPYTRNATVAHYGMNRTGGKLMYNASGNSEDCIYCHRNNSNMAAWGVLNTSNANLSKKGGTHAASPNQDCYICHVNSTGMPANLHVQELNAGVGGGPDCKACHDTGGSATGRLVNFSAINGSLAIHKNLNKNASDPTGYPENRICWACHTTNGTAPQAGNHSFVDRYKNPYNCTDCHISKAGQNLNFTPRAILNVTQHKADTVNGTTIFTPGAADCYSCHNISEMMIQANDPDNGTGAVYGGSHGGDASVSHYGLKRDLGSDDAYCNYCHSNASSMFPFVSQHNKTIFEHTRNSTADIRNGTTLNCTDCHTTNQQSYRIHNSTLRTPSASAWTAGREDRCAPCHRTTGPGSSLKVNNTYHNTTGNITDCGYCHNSDAMKIGAPQNIHSDNLTRGGNSTYDNCYNCHQNGFASKIIIEHTNSTGANITNASMTCEKSGCHNSSRTHSKALIKPAVTNWTAGGNDYCAPCHNSSDSVNNATKKIYNKGHDPANRTNDNITSCGNCHNASTPGGIPGPFRLHDPSSTNFGGSDDSTCEGCHNGTSLYVGAGKLILSHMPNASEYRGNTSASNFDCKYCHNMTNKPSMHSAGMNRSSGTCETCHFNNTSPFRSLTKNISHLAGMLNHSYNGSSNTACKMCHNASGRAKFHLSKYASGDIADPQDANGNPTFVDRATWDLGLAPPETNDRGILVDCRDCHEKYNDTAPFFAPFQEANRTGINNQEHVGKNYTLKNCYVCHTAEDNVSRPFTLHNVSIEPLTGGPNCTKCHDIASQNRTLSHMLWVNYTAFNSTGSIHRNFTNATAWGGSALFTLLDTACWVCHESDGMQPERHTDLLDDPTLAGGSRAYRCEACHTVGGLVSDKQPSIYQKATKVYKHYPGSIFLNEINFTGNVSCGMCHKNGMVSSINISGYTNNIDANTTNVSHYGIRARLTNTSLNLNGCQKCHGVGGEGQDTLSYGNARTMPSGHNDMGSTPQACQKSCHNSAVGDNGLSVPIKLHNNSVGINIGGNACFSPECHPSPPEGGGGGGRR